MVATRQISIDVISPWQSDALGYVPSNWYAGILQGFTSITGVAASVTTQYFVPFVVRQAITIGALGLRTLTPGTSNIQLGIYASDTGAVLNRPGALLGNTGNIANTGAAGFYSGALGANVQLTPGIYWMAYQCNDTTCLVLSCNAICTPFEVLIGSSTGAGAIGALSTSTVGVGIPSTFGTWATAHGATFTEQNNQRAPIIAFQVVSQP